MRIIFWFLVIVLEVAASGVFFYAATQNNLPSQVSMSAWVLGGCCLGTAILFAVEEFYLRPRRNKMTVNEMGIRQMIVGGLLALCISAVIGISGKLIIMAGEALNH